MPLLKLTNKRRRDTTYTSKMIAKTGIPKCSLVRSLLIVLCRRTKSPGNRTALPVRTAEETRHNIASSLEGKMKNHPIQCIPPNIAPTTGKINNAGAGSSFFMEEKVDTFISSMLMFSESTLPSISAHLNNRNKAGMTKTKVRRMEKVSARRNGIIIVKGIDIKTLLKMGRGCQMMVIF